MGQGGQGRDPHLHGAGRRVEFFARRKASGNDQASRNSINCTWGDADGEALTMTARTWIYRIRLKIEGSGLNMVPAYLATCPTAS